MHSRLLPSLILFLGVVALASTPREGPAHAQGAQLWTRTAVWAPSYDAGALLDPAGMSAAGGGGLFVADVAHHRIAVVDGAGRVVRSFGSEGRGADQLQDPVDVAVDVARNRVYVVDRGNKRIAVFDTAGQPLGAITLAGPEYSFVPLAVAVSPASGEVFALSTSIVPRVERFAADGRWLTGWGDLGVGPGRFVAPVDLAVHGDGRLLVADSGTGRIQLFDATGAPVGEWSGLPAILSVDVEPGAGRVYALIGNVPDRIVVLDSLGQTERTVDSGSLPADARFRPGRRLAVAAGGRLAVTTGFGAQTAEHGLRQFDAATFTLSAATVADPRNHGGFVAPTALDVDAAGNPHLLDDRVRMVKRYDRSGAFLGRSDAGNAHAIAIAPDGSAYVADVRNFVRLRRIDPGGNWAWDKACDCLSGMGIAAATDRVYASDAVSRTIQVFDLDPDRPLPVDTIDIADAPYVWPGDLDLGPDGNLYVLDMLQRRVHVVVPASGVALRSFSLPGPGDRVSVGSDGMVYVLMLDGSVLATDGAGQRIGSWRVEAPAGGAPPRPLDLAAGAGGRVYVLDGQSHAVFVYDSSPDPGLTPTPPPTPPSPCTATGNKTAQPSAVTLADEVTVTLTLEIACQGDQGTRADIVLVFDRSSSMAGASCSNSKLCEAQRAAKSFVAGLDLTRHRVGLVSFSEVVTLDLPLTSDRARIDAAIDAVQAAGNTNIAGALAAATSHVAVAARPGALPVYLLLTDGDPSGTEQAFADAVREGVRAQQTGGLTYSVGLGANVNAELLTVIAGAAERYFFAPGSEDLQQIYDRLSESIGEIAATDLVIEDEMAPQVEYVPSSASDNPSVQRDTLVWTVGAAPAALSFTYRVRPLSTGRHPTNNRADARYKVAGVDYRFVFPVPEIDVGVEPTATPPPPTPDTRTIYLPVAMQQQRCSQRDRDRGADVVLVIDVSSSMEGVKLAAAIDAAQTFVGLVDPRRDHVGVVAFESSARLVHELSANLTAVRGALAGLTAGTGTRIDLGINGGLRELAFRSRPGSPAVIVLLSDGRPAGGSEGETLAAAAEARRQGIVLFAIGLGEDADRPYLSALATSPGHFLAAPSPADLGEAYRRVADMLPCR